MLEILVGLARVKVRRPRTMPDCPVLTERCRPVASPLRRKTTLSVRRISRVFLCGLDAAMEAGVAEGCMAMARCS